MKNVYHAKCSAKGCGEVGLIPYHSRAEYRDLIASHGHGKWKCLRHRVPSEVISIQNPVQRFDITSSRKNGKLGWYHLPFLCGPGFVVFAADFPEGTRLEVTARVNLPGVDLPPEGK
jgi:hypothetical protein